MLRLTGSLLLLGASFLLSATLARAEAKRMRRGEGLLLLVRHIGAQISCYRTPIFEIYASFSHKELEECGFLPLVRERGLLQALEQMQPLLLWDAQDLAPLLSFAALIGKGQSADEIKLCQYTEKELEGMLARRRTEAPKRTRVLQTLSISGGLMLLVLLL